MPSRLTRIYSRTGCVERLLWDFHKIKVCGKVSILKMMKINSFIGALKTPVLLFQKYFQVKLR